MKTGRVSYLIHRTHNVIFVTSDLHHPGIMRSVSYQFSATFFQRGIFSLSYLAWLLFSVMVIQRPINLAAAIFSSYQFRVTELLLKKPKSWSTRSRPCWPTCKEISGLKISTDFSERLFFPIYFCPNRFFSRHISHRFLGPFLRFSETIFGLFRLFRSFLILIKQFSV